MRAALGRLRGTAALLAAYAPLALAAVALGGMLAKPMQEATGFAGRIEVFSDYFAALLLALALALIIAAWPRAGRDRTRLLLLWGIKALVTLLVLPVYEAHYGAQLDAYGYFRIGALGQAPMPPLTFGDGSGIVIWLASWLTRALPAYFHLLEMLWSFVGLLAIYAFYRGWRWLVPQLDSRFLLWIGLFPSILFWTSIFGKDPVCALGVGLYFFAVARLNATGTLRSLWLAALGVVIAAAIRPWYALILLVPLAVLALSGRHLRGWQKLLLLAIVAGGAVLAAQAFLSRFGINDLSSLIAASDQISHSWAIGGSAQKVPQFTGPVSMLAFVTPGIFTAFFRPLPGELQGGPALLASVENLVLLLAFARAVWRTPLRALRCPWVAWLVLMLLIWGAMYAFPSSQNLGTAERFKLEIMPIFWPLVLLGAASRLHWGLVPLRYADARVLGRPDTVSDVTSNRGKRTLEPL